MALVPLSICQADQASNSRSIALLHMAPVLATEIADLDTNTDRIIEAMALAKAAGADWVLTPELALTGYKFRYQLGTDWIKPGIDRWTQKLQKTADDLDLVLLLSHLQQDPETGQRHNQIFVIDRDGEISICAIFKPNRRRKPACHFAVSLALSCSCANCAPTNHVLQVLRRNRV